jgi:hypothetical protein
MKAQGSQIGGGVGQAYHRQRSGMVLAVKRSESSEAAGGRIGWIVEPEADVKGVGRRQRRRRAGVEPEDLIDYI